MAIQKSDARTVDIQYRLVRYLTTSTVGWLRDVVRKSRQHEPSASAAAVVKVNRLLITDCLHYGRAHTGAF